MLKVQGRETQPKGVLTVDSVCLDICLKDCLGEVKLSLVIDDTRKSTERKQGSNCLKKAAILFFEKLEGFLPKSDISHILILLNLRNKDSKCLYFLIIFENSFN